VAQPCRRGSPNNQGRTWGTITTSSLSITNAPALPAEPRYPISSVQNSDTFVEAKSDFVITRPNIISDSHWDKAGRGEIILWIYGYFEYRDFLKNTHVEGFCFGSRPAEQAYVSGGRPVEWVSTGPPSYTYSKYKNDDES
jgi:hypothetical protein